MKFYRLTLSTDEKIIGRYPQSTEMLRIGDFGKDENFKLGIYGPITNLDIHPITKLQSQAFLTTVIDSSYLRPQYFLTVRIELINLFDNFNIPDFEVFESPVHHNNKVYDYKLFHIDYPSNDELIDFKSSEFYVGKRGLPPSELSVSVNTFEEYLILQKQVKIDYEGNNLLCKKILLDFSQCNLDMFRLTVVPALGYFVSEKLKHAIEERGFTGFDFKEIEVDPKIEVA